MDPHLLPGSIYFNSAVTIGESIERDTQVWNNNVMRVNPQALLQFLAQSLLSTLADAVSKRGTRHLRELERVVKNGDRGVIFYCVQHTGIKQVQPADEIDPVYGQTLRKAIAAGVEAIAYATDISPDKIGLTSRLRVICP